MTATYTFDVFCSLDDHGSFEGGDSGGFWGKEGPEFLEHRLAEYRQEQRLVLGATTFRTFLELLGPGTPESEADDPLNTRMRDLPTTVVSTTLHGPFDWPDATVVSGTAAEVVAALKEDSAVPLRSHGSLSLFRSLLAAGLVDRVQVTVSPVLTGRTGVEPVFAGADDFDLELLGSTTFDGRIQELVHRPTLHSWG